MGVSSTLLDDVKKHTQKNQHSYENVKSVTLYDITGQPIENSVTPTIIEERKMNVAMMSVFDRLMMDRIIWCAGPVDDRMAIIVQAQLLYLSQEDPKKTITMHIDSPGGSVKSGLSMVDVMNYIDADIQTINTGMAASMGSVLLGAGTKGMRSSLKFSRTMLHQSSGGAVGNIQDARISFNEWEKINKLLFELLGGYCDKDPKQVEEDASRDLWLSSEQALEYGIIDDIVGK
jgi:ATP-dependent Clp protease protease subunit